LPIWTTGSSLDALDVGEAEQLALDALGQEGVAGLPAAAGGVLPGRDAQPGVAVDVADVLGLDLWNLERPQADLATEADVEGVAVASCSSSEAVVLVGDEPALLRVVVLVALDSPTLVRTTANFNRRECATIGPKSGVFGGRRSYFYSKSEPLNWPDCKEIESYPSIGTV